MSTPRDLKQQSADKRRLRIDDIRAVLSTPAGQRFVWDLCEDRGSSFAAGDALSMAYLEGRRSVQLELKAEIQRVAAPHWVDMVRARLAAMPVDLPQVEEPTDEE